MAVSKNHAKAPTDRPICAITHLSPSVLYRHILLWRAGSASEPMFDHQVASMQKFPIQTRTILPDQVQVIWEIWGREDTLYALSGREADLGSVSLLRGIASGSEDFALTHSLPWMRWSVTR
jgi:hypothetical protein